MKKRITSVCFFSLFYWSLFSQGTCLTCPLNTIQGPELIVNGDFAAGNTGFTSDYTFNAATGLADGEYSVRNSTNLMNGQWSGFDHTTGTVLGNFLVCDGSTNPVDVCWRTTVLVTPGSQYNFCAFTNNLVIPTQNHDDPVVEVSINGTFIIGAALTEAPDGWVLLTIPWTATATTALIEIRSSDGNAVGNDFALDDISFVECAPPPKCSQISAFLEQLHTVPPFCCFRLFFDNQADSCFTQINFQLNSATFTNLSVDAFNGWSVSQPNPDELVLTHNSGFIPVGNFQAPLSWCVVGGSNPDTVAVSFKYPAAGALETCDTSFAFSCPTVTCPFCPPNTVQGPELIVNGDFAAGNTGFTSDYTFNAATGLADGEYSVRNSTNLMNGQWSGLDHTTGTVLGNFLVCDGSTNPVDVCWRTTVLVTPGSQYNFCAFTNNLVIPTQNHDDPVVEVSINGTFIIGAALTEAPDGWVLLTIPWTATATTALIEIRSSDGNAVGNDFALDDISFVECAPPPKCSQISAFLEQLHTVPPFCCFRLFFDNQADSCFTQINFQLNSATFTDLSVDAFNGWSVSQPNPDELVLTHNSGFIPVGNFQAPLSWCVVGGSNPDTVAVSFKYPAAGALETCDTSFTFSCPFVDVCCLDHNLFCQNVQNAVNITVDNNLCKATLVVGSLPACDHIAHINWGDGNTSAGPFVSGAMPMHTYTQSGTYIISYLAIEINPNTGFICFEKVLSDTIVLNCSDVCPQNLVPNPSFETFITCPVGLGEFPTNWTSPATGASPDYYNACATLISGMGAPANMFGNQAPRTGAGYMGFILRPSNVYREYIEVQLTAPLIAGVTYQVSFYVSLSDQSSWAIDKLGAYLSGSSVGPVPGAPVLSFTPQVANPLGNFITSKFVWTLVSGNYVALGGEQYLVIGNFSDNPSTTPIMGLGGFYQGAYYYIDDVSICRSAIAPPLTLTCPPDITAYAEAGAIGAVVTFPQPTAQTTCNLTPACDGQAISGFTFIGQKSSSNYYLSDSYKTWSDAKADAEVHGGKLAVITSSEENQFILNGIGFTDAAFIGLTDQDSEGNFHWIDGQPLSFTFWESGQPDNGSGSGENYVAMEGWAGGRWADYNALVAKRYVMEVACGVSIQGSSIPSGAVFPVGVTAISFTAFDACLNTDTCSFNVTVLPVSDCDSIPILSLAGTATQSSTRFGAEAGRANDGNTSGAMWTDYSVSHTEWEFNAWWEIDLNKVYDLTDIRIWNRTDCCGEWLKKYYVLVSETPFVSNDLNETLAQPGVFPYFQPDIAGTPTKIQIGQKGRYVRIQLIDQAFLALAEVQIFGCIDNFSGNEPGNQALLSRTSMGGSVQYSNGLPTNVHLAPEFIVYPNPASTELFINVVSQAGKMAVIELFDTKGERRMIEQFDELPDMPLRIGLGAFQEGIYLMMVKVEGRKYFSKKIVVIK